MSSLGEVLRRHSLAVATIFLALQAVGFHVFSQNEHAPKTLPLQLVSTDTGGWVTEEEASLEGATMEILSPDDHLYRMASRARDGARASVFVAYFKSQRTGHAPHTPRNCLPGNGWTPEETGIVELASRGGKKFEVNRTVIAKERSRSVVIYWYQTASRTVANEYWAKLYLMRDAIWQQRSDTALVRVIVPVTTGQKHADEVARDFSGVVYEALAGHFPPFL